MAEVASQLSHCSVALRAVPVLCVAETILSSASPPLSSLKRGDFAATGPSVLPEGTLFPSLFAYENAYIFFADFPFK